MFFSDPNEEMTMAFAGIFQSSVLVQELARQPHHDEDALRESTLSLLRMKTDTTAEVFGSVSGLRLGLQTLIKMFGGQTTADGRELFHYAVSMHQLSLKLHQQRRLSASMGQRLAEISNQYYPESDDVVLEEQLFQDLADLYSETISNMSPRIIVRGEHGRLENASTVAKVRTALFAGIRAGYLWHQLGGRKWQLVFQRKAYYKLARGLTLRAV